MVESKSMKVHRERLVLFSAGAVVAAAAFILVLLGNPGNMGFCIACFLRDIAGSLGLHSSATTQYLRPEIPGLVLGAFIVALARGEFRPTSGSSPVIRFIIAACVSIGALVFLGCPLRMVLRLAAGDLNALFGLVGFVIGIGLGCIALNFGFSLGRTKECSAIEGTSAPLLSVFLLILAFTAPSFLKASTEGPGSMHAPIFASLLMGLVVGALAQRSRLCFAGGVRDIFLMRDTTLITGFASVFAVALVLNLVSGNFRLGFEGQSVAHTDWLWNILAMVVVGFGSVLLGGCPLRQLILAGEGSGDSTAAVLGLVIGGALAHNFGLASSTAGATGAGKVATVLIIVFFALLSVTVVVANRRKEA